jgi:hypothetical protein
VSNSGCLCSIFIGYPRELYLECPDDHDKWVTELQEPITSG